MITIKLAIAVIAFLLSSGQIVFQTFQHHHAVNPRHGFIKFLVFILSSLSLIYLAKDIYEDFEGEKPAAVVTNSAEIQAERNYWHNVYDNPSPEGYCAYLEKFPNGEFTGIAKSKIDGDCTQVKQQAEMETRKKVEMEAAALKEKLENETKALAEKNAVLEKEAKENAARIAALEQAKPAAAPIPQLDSASDMQLEAELKAKFESDTTIAPQSPVPTAEMPSGAEVKPKPEPKIDESLF